MPISNASFSNMKITTKIYLGFSLLMLVLVIMGAYSFLASQSLGGMFSEYRTAARSNLILGSTVENYLLARESAFQYRLNDDPKYVDKAKEYIAQIIDDKDTLKSALEGSDVTEKVLNLDAKLSDYSKLFDQGVTIQKQYKEKRSQLNEMASKIRQALTELRSDSAAQGIQSVTNNAAMAQEHFLLTRLYIDRYLETRKTEDLDRAKNEIFKSHESLQALLNSTDIAFKSDTETILTQFAEFQKLFEAMLLVLEEKNSIYAQQDQVGEDLQSGYVDVVEQMVALQNTIGPKVQESVKQKLIILPVVILVAVIFGSLISVFIGRMVSSALGNVTTIMQRLSEGDFTVKITGTERGDEIGVMARAMEIFKDEAEKSFLLKQMVDDMPTNVMTVNVKDNLKVNYINNTSVGLFKKIEQYLPVKSDQVVGQKVDIFYKDPESYRRILSNESNLPHSSKVQIGPEIFDLLMAPIRNKQGEYVGAMLAWTLITARESMAANVSNVVNVVGSAVTELEATAQSLSSMAEQTQMQASAVAAAAEEAASNVSTVAASTEELTSSINEITKRVQDSASKASVAASQAKSTNEAVASLSKAAEKIGQVVKLINDIAEQTNLLALNATIEAARAGEAGKGFAVVASEVKNLASQTAKATEEIGTQIAEMQSATTLSVDSIQIIAQTITELNEIASGVAAAVEEQASATQEIARSVEQASEGTKEVTRNITMVSQAAQETGESSRQVLMTAQELGKQSTTLQKEVTNFMNGS